jgi:hypothetical protein
MKLKKNINYKKDIKKKDLSQPELTYQTRYSSNETEITL